jgi:hypothetical protein
LAAEEISKLDIGCAPGYTPPSPTPTPDPCDGNDKPSIDSVLLDGTAVSIGETVFVVVGTPYVVTVNASDPDGILGTLTYSATIDGIPVGTVASNVITVPPPPLVVGTFEVLVHVNDGCDPETWGPVTVVVCAPLDPALAVVVDDASPCSGDPATITSVTATWGGTDHVFNIPYAASTPGLSWVVREPGAIIFSGTSGEVTLGTGSLGTDYHVDFTYEDECEEKATGTATVNFNAAPTADAGADGEYDKTVCAGSDATINFSGSGTGVGDLSYSWDFGDGGSSTEQNPSHTYANPFDDSYTVTLTVTDDCSSATDEVVVTITEISCCPDPIIDLLEFRVKLPSDGADFENWTNMFGYVYSTEPDKTNPAFVPGTTYYDINTGEHGTPKFGFKVVEACGTLDLKYNWWRGDSCTADWLENDNNIDNWDTLLDGLVVPGWRDISIGGVYPISDSENSLCNQGGNILVIKVTGDTGIVQIYRIDINRLVSAG